MTSPAVPYGFLNPDGTTVVGVVPRTVGGVTQALADERIARETTGQVITDFTGAVVHEGDVIVGALSSSQLVLARVIRIAGRQHQYTQIRAIKVDPVTLTAVDTATLTLAHGGIMLYKKKE
jgi:uncharacterized membrane protein